MSLNQQVIIVQSRNESAMPVDLSVAVSGSITTIKSVSGSVFAHDLTVAIVSGSIQTKKRFSGDLGIAPIEAAPFFPDYQLIIGVNSTPIGSEPANQEYKAILLIDSVEIETKSVSIEADPRGIGATVNVALHDINQRNLITKNSHIELTVRSLVGGVWKSKKLIDSNKMESSSWSVSATEEGFSFSAADSVSKLFQTPGEDFTLYDYNRAELNKSDFPVVLDNFGGKHRAQLVPYGSLSLYRILNEVSKRCGFAGFKTKIEDYLVDRLDFGGNSTYLDSLAGTIGMHRPLIYEKDNHLCIDSKVRKTSTSVPALRKLKADMIESLSVQRKFNQIDGLTLNFQSNELETLLYRVKYGHRVYKNENGNTVTIDTRSHEFYHADNPEIEIKTELVYSRTETVDSTSGLRLGVVTEEHEYDLYGREVYAHKVQNTRIIDLSTIQLYDVLNGSNQVIGQKIFADQIDADVWTDTMHIKYATNPFKPTQQYISQFIVSKTGRIFTTLVDHGDYFAEIKQPAVDATTSRNFNFSTTEEDIEVYREDRLFSANANGSSECLKIITNRLDNVVSDFQREPNQGDASIPNRLPNRKMLLFAGNSATRTGNPMPDFFTGALPSWQARKLAESELDRMANGRDRAFSVSLIGYDDTLVQGTELALYDHNDQFVANVIINGYKVDISAEETKTQLLVEEL